MLVSLNSSNKSADFHVDATDSEQWQQLPWCDWIITNPPYGSATAPILQSAYQKARVGIVMFLRCTFPEPCEDRSDFLEQFPPSLVLVYPRFKFRRGKTGAWSSEAATISAFVWDKRIATQRFLIRPASKILGFYQNPSEAISFEEALAHLNAIQNHTVSTSYLQVPSGSLTQQRKNSSNYLFTYKTGGKTKTHNVTSTKIREVREAIAQGRGIEYIKNWILA